ncbi:MAG: biotin/lipoyl-binding protein [Candidatus Heimdallarchaeota archaeon]|nr:MAG: biotin/lipoyl-binding protein [Candidatus Heimdallarchaeota archaeon]
MSEVFNFNDGTKRYEVRLRRNEDNSYIVVINRGDEEEEKELQVSAKVLGAGQFQFTLDNIIYKCSVAKDGDVRFIHLDGEDYEIKRISEAVEEFGEAEEDLGSLSSPMPGRIVKLLVKPGDRVKKGQDLVVVEAMKMENKIAAPFDGTVIEVFFPEGDQIEANVPLIEIEEEKDPNEENEDESEG